MPFTMFLRPQDGLVPLFPDQAGNGFDTDLLNSPEARIMRNMSQFQRSGNQLDEEEIENMMTFFGSARAKSREKYEAALAESLRKVSQNPQKAFEELLSMAIEISESGSESSEEDEVRSCKRARKGPHVRGGC
eukprot:gnl/MRDRNA2_/MRDRNA2_90389_c0_seq1.p1 gnl/MRDRNA2_/MRDRNA2_90389_c0~~gnl/MRDRNA2_/MRDRNA2_90389_c0_seq1.p1  ORF type:complete len:133 (+),score=26.19 gnl/MRDRNA2_/MRDRNA2_90389_c0_seq1:66-464(+)